MKKIIALSLSLLLPSAGLCQALEAAERFGPIEAPTTAGPQALASLDEMPLKDNSPGAALPSLETSAEVFIKEENLGPKTAEPAPQDFTPVNEMTEPSLGEESTASLTAPPLPIRERGQIPLRQAALLAGNPAQWDGDKTGDQAGFASMASMSKKGLGIAAFSGGAVPLSAMAALAQAPSHIQAAPGLAVSAAAMLHAAGASTVLKGLAAAGYAVGNAGGMVVDYPRLRAAAASKNPDAVSLGSNAILMAASVLMAARAYLTGDAFLAWQNLVSGVLPMAIALLQHEKTRKMFPEGEPGLSAAGSNVYSRTVTNKRLAALILYGAVPTVILGLLGHVFLAPLALEGVSRAIPFALQAVASGGFVYYLVPQIRQIKKSNSIEGLDKWYYAGVLAICLGLGIWSLDKTLLEIKPGVIETAANLNFWTHLIYSVQGFLAAYFAKATLAAMARVRGQKS
jgi:hypothetical protein